MPWTAPPEEPLPEPGPGDERSILIETLDQHRRTLLRKCAGLTGEELTARSVAPSTLSLLGLVRHLTDVERTWFRIRLADETVGDVYFTEDHPDRDFDDLDPTRAQADLARYRQELVLVDEAIDGHDLEDTFYSGARGTQLSLRWLLVHMVAEYARHNGHADLLRQRIDGATGD